ncbi:peptidase M3A and M3B thimet/oligopeptidase F [Candidatus Fermentibacteria bacterium]|nr:MAG: peptidase M3A and M3B thimet/oligopeptidase F [Candidatus Fermentibacteria bacterium]
MKRLFAIAEELNQLHVKSSRLNWSKFTTGYDFGIMDIRRQIQEKLKNKKSWKIIQDLLASELSIPDLRRVRIMEMVFRPYHLSEKLNELSLAIQEKTNELSSVLNTHRCTVAGRVMTSPEISRILLSEPDRDLRKEACLSRTQINIPMVNAGFLQLLEMRKEYAHEFGAPDFVHYQLEHQELDPVMFDSWKDEVKSVLPLMREIRSSFGEEIIGDPNVMPWDTGYISGKIAPELNQQVNMADYHSPISELFGMFDINISGMNITYDIFPRKNKSEWGYNFPIESGVDSRILANVRDRYSEYGVLLHETGHAVHSFTTDPEEIIMNMGISGIVSEGIANLFGRFTTHEAFYSGFFGEKLAEAGKNFKRLKLWNRVNKLRSVSRILLDQALYRTRIENIDDIHQLLWKTNMEVLGEQPYADMPIWASTIHFTTHPVYFHNYLLGDLMCDMLDDVFLKRENVSDVTERPELFGRFILDEVIGVSGRYPFPDLFRRISGEELSLRLLSKRLRKEADEQGIS